MIDLAELVIRDCRARHGASPGRRRINHSASTRASTGLGIVLGYQPRVRTEDMIHRLILNL